MARRGAAGRDVPLSSTPEPLRLPTQPPGQVPHHLRPLQQQVPNCLLILLHNSRWRNDGESRRLDSPGHLAAGAAGRLMSRTDSERLPMQIIPLKIPPNNDSARSNQVFIFLTVKLVSHLN